MSKQVLGVIGGSGLYDIDGLTNKQWKAVASPFGNPSDELLFGELDGQQLVFLPRHGRGHRIPPSEINYRANIDALKKSGVTEILSISAVGSLREDLSPGTFVIIDQFIDRTFARKKSFFESGLVAHVSMAQPVCNRLGNLVQKAASSSKIRTVHGGTYLVMEGPQFSTLAESQLYRSWKCDVIGMTNMPEAKLAREAEICYASIAMVTDYDCWHPNHDDVTVEQIIQVLLVNADAAKRLVKNVSPLIFGCSESESCSCHHALDHALITSSEYRDPSVLQDLESILKRVMAKK